MTHHSSFETLLAKPWLPRGFEFLAGLPEPKRQRRLLLVIQAYIDDSGTRGTHPVFTMAGFIGEAEKWASLSNAWSDHLQAKPSIRYLKMAQAVKLSRQFRNWKPCERDDKLKGFVEIIKAHTPQKAIHFTVDLQAFEQHMATRVPMPDPMFIGCYVILAGVGHEVLDAGPSHQIEVIFDEHVIVGPRVKLWYPLIKASFKGREEYDLARLADILPRSQCSKATKNIFPCKLPTSLLGSFARPTRASVMNSNGSRKS